MLDADRDIADPVAIVTSPTGDLTLKLWTDRPGLQFYNAMMTNVPVPGLNGKKYGQFSGFCLEDQAFPDTPHDPALRSPKRRMGMVRREMAGPWRGRGGRRAKGRGEGRRLHRSGELKRDLATGNLIFGSDQSVAAVRREITGLVESFGLTSSEVFIVTKAQIGKIVAADPFPAASKDHPQRLGVCVFHKALDLAHSAAAAPTVPKTGRGRSAAPSSSTMAQASLHRRSMSKSWPGARMTQRNWNTVLGIWQRMQNR